MNTEKLVGKFDISGFPVGSENSCYFIADIAANHDGDINRAFDLIELAKDAGAHCAKFQHFQANSIVSNFEFSKSGKNVSHQSTWKKSVYEIYEEYHTREEWTEALYKKCQQVGIEFMTTPYNANVLSLVDPYVNAYKIGSGDLTYKNLQTDIAKLGKPVFLATGASELSEVERAINHISKYNNKICLMQCNTNYTGSNENFKHVNLNVLKTFRDLYKKIPLGFSDHTPGHSAVLGAVALGASVIEKHFTDDNTRTGPDHNFALNPKTWRNMVDGVKELLLSMGDGIKRIEENELETVVIQRRAIVAARNLNAGAVINRDDIDFLRPCSAEAFTPFQTETLLGRKLRKNINKGEAFLTSHLMD